MIDRSEDFEARGRVRREDADDRVAAAVGFVLFVGLTVLLDFVFMGGL